MGILVKFVWFMVFIGFLQAIFGGLLNSVTPNTKLAVSQKTDGSVIGFFNGVWVNKDEANIHIENIHSRFGDKTPSGKSLQYQLFYNDSYGPTLDLIETFDQRMTLIGMGGQYDFFWGLASGDRTELKRASDGSIGTTEVIDSLAQMFSDGTFNYLKGLYADKKISTSASHRQIINQLTDKKSNQSLILLAHSQGNLFALQAYDYAIRRSKAVSIVHAAPPLDIIRGEYILSNTDTVINALRNVFGHVLPANVAVPISWSGHGFAEVYFNPETGAGKMTETAVLNMLNKQH